MCYLNSNKLSVRLKTVAKYVPNGARIADIGSDHAYLPCYLAKHQKIESAIAGEVVEGPYQSAVRNVKAEGLTEMIEVRMGDGLEVIHPGEVDCITIAGMGGTLIANILEDGKEKLSTVNRLILQPNISAISIRKWLLENGWELINEEIVEEDGKIYEILVAEKGDPKRPYDNTIDIQLLMGPFLLKKQDEVFKKKWLLELKNWQRINKQLEQAAQKPETIPKRRELEYKIKLVKEGLHLEETERS